MALSDALAAFLDLHHAKDGKKKSESIILTLMIEKYYLAFEITSLMKEGKFNSLLHFPIVLLNQLICQTGEEPKSFHHLHSC